VCVSVERCGKHDAFFVGIDSTATASTSTTGTSTSTTVDDTVLFRIDGLFGRNIHYYMYIYVGR
jgi:hypothetical protein